MVDIELIYDVSILIVDDDAASRILMASLLKGKVAKIFIAKNGRQGLELFEYHHPQIVIADIAMPYMDGFDMSRKIKEIDPKTRIILTTAFDYKNYLLDAIELGVDQYLIKPVKKELFYAAIQKIVDVINLERSVNEQYDYIRKISRAVEQGSNCILFFTNAGTIEYANPTFYSVTGYDPTEIIGHTVMDLSFFGYEDYSFIDFQESIVARKEPKGDYLFKRKDGNQIWISLSVSPVRNQYDEILHYVAVFDDITERKYVQHELQKAKEELEERVMQRTAELREINFRLLQEIEVRKRTEEELVQAKDLAETANKTKSTFLAKVSHELRTPMNGIIGITSILLGTKLDEKQKKFLNMVKISSDNLLKIINDILDITKIEAGKIEFYNSDFALKTLLEQTTELFRHNIRSKGLKLQYHLEAGLPRQFIGDPVRIQQVLDNLIANSVKFTDRGYIDIRVKCNEVKGNIAELEFAVKDTGIGIPEGKQKMLFTSFSQVDDSFTRRFGGTGLGLAISKDLVEMMDGAIWVESVFGKGSTFFFTIKLQVHESDTATDKLTQSMDVYDLKHLAAQFPSYPIRILVAEDSIINQEVLKQILSTKDWEVVMVSSGSEALEAFVSNGFDIILMDVQMPGGDGIQTTRLIREYEATSNAHTPIVGLTAHDDDFHKQECFDAGMDSFLTKPFDWKEIFEIIIQFTIKGRGEEIYNNQSDLDGLMRSLNGNAELFNKLGSYYIDNYPTELQTLSNAIEENDYSKVQQMSHKIKSEIGNFGAGMAIDLARKLELDARNNDLGGARDLFVALTNELDQIKENLIAMMSTAGED